jgi:hypothetical protein
VAVLSSHGQQANDDATRAGSRDALTCAVVDVAVRAVAAAVSAFALVFFDLVFFFPR